MAREQSERSARGRRGFLKSSVGVGGGLAAASFIGAFGLGGADAPADDLATIVNLAATAETLAVAFYYAVLAGATFHIGEDDAERLKLVMDAEMHHLQILQSLGGRSLTERFYLPARVLSDARTFVDTGLRAETVFAGAYLAATHQLAALGQPALAATAAQHGASEAQHLTLIGHVAGLGPRQLTLPAPLYYHTSDALPELAPFIKGGAGFGQPASFPSPGQYQSALGGVAAVRSRSFLEAYGKDTISAGYRRAR